MKKILLLCSIIMCCFSAYSQNISFTTTSTTAASGTDITIKAVGEVKSSYVLGISYKGLSSVPFSTLITGAFDGSATFYNPTTKTPTSFPFKVTNNTSAPATVTYSFIVTPVDGNTSTSLPGVECSVTLTVQPDLSPKGNEEQHQTFTKNDCGSGSVGSVVTYSVPAGRYTASSVGAANQLALADISANGQNYANANGTCLTPSLSGNFKICDSPNGAATTVSVINVPAGVSVVWTVTGRLTIIGSNTNNSLTVQVDPDSTSPAPFKVIATLSNGTVLGRLLVISCN